MLLNEQCQQQIWIIAESKKRYIAELNEVNLPHSDDCLTSEHSICFRGFGASRQADRGYPESLLAETMPRQNGGAMAAGLIWERAARRGR